MNLHKPRTRPYYANDNDALIPEKWAAESLFVLEENMVMGNLVHRDFEPEIAEYGDTVNTRKPNAFTARRKTDADDVTTQDASSTNIAVVLNQWIHTSFVIKDGERSKAFPDLVDFYLQPAMTANAHMLDAVLAGQSVQFLDNVRGGLGLLDEDNAKEYLIATRDMMNQNKVPSTGRNLILGSASEATLLNTDLFISAEKVGDGGQALREAELGRKFAFQNYMNLNVPACTAATTGTATTVDGTVAAGGTSIVLDDDVLVPGQYFVVADEGTPARVKTQNATTATIISEIYRPFLRAATDAKAVTTYENGAVVGGFASGYVKEIVVDGTGVPHVGQLVSFSTNATPNVPLEAEYTIVNVDDNGDGTYDILLDRPLEAALVNDYIVNYGPNGEYNFAFHHNALALINRPLATPMSGLALSANATYNGMSMRVVITYDGKSQGHRVTLDGLFGVKVLDTALGGVLLG